MALASYKAKPPIDDDLEELSNQLLLFDWKEDAFEKTKNLVFSSDHAEVVEGLRSLKRQLSKGREEVFDVAEEAINAGMVPLLVKFLSSGEAVLRQLAGFCLTNICAGHDEQTVFVVNQGVIAPLVRMLEDESEPLRRQAIFCLGNIAGATPQCRVMLAQTPGYFERIISAVRNSFDPKVMNLAVWNVRNLCVLGGPSFTDILPAVHFFADYITTSTGEQAKAVHMACEAVATICRSEAGRQTVCNLGIADQLLYVAKYHDMVCAKAYAIEAIKAIATQGRANERGCLVGNNALSVLLTVACGKHEDEMRQNCMESVAALVEDFTGDVMQLGSSLIAERGVEAAPFPFAATCHRLAREPISSEFGFRMSLYCVIALCRSLLSLSNDDVAVSSYLSSTVLDTIVVGLELATCGLSEVTQEGLKVVGQLVTALFEAMARMLIWGNELRIASSLIENPVAKMMLDMQVPDKLRGLLQTVPLHCEAFRHGSEILTTLTG